MKKFISQNKESLLRSILLTAFIIGLAGAGWGQPQTDTHNSSQNWVVPEGVTQITVQAWGGGGAGGGSTNAGFFQGRGGAGGGGGAYASSTINVTPGSTIRIQVAGQISGVSGAHGNSNGPSFVGPDTNPSNAWVRAAGGSGGTGNTGGGSPAGGAGGTVAASIGDTRTAGANGGNGATGFGINSGAGGNGASGGGSGGSSITGGTNIGITGVVPGGGGSGGRTSGDGGSRAGGTGAAGRVIITYTIPECENGTLALSSTAGTDAQIVCENSTITNITYTVGGDATGATVNGLPSGVTGNFSGGVFTISGTPTEDGIFNYTVTTTGVNSPCLNASANGSITVNALPTFTHSISEPDCFGVFNGTITLTASNGSGTYQYSKDAGENWQSSNVFSGLGQGNYTIQVKDSNGCIQTNCSN